MNKNFLLSILAVCVNGVMGLSGGVLPVAFVHRHIANLLAFAAGTLIGTALLELFPDAIISSASPSLIMSLGLLGFITFYVVETMFGSHAPGQSGHKHDTIGPLILVGDAIHNATDGIAIAAAFSLSIASGFIAALAVIVHEIPQEVGDFGILVSHGYTRGKALFYLVLVQFTALLGALGTLWFASKVSSASYYCTALSAGGFLYIAAADLLPELQKRQSGQPVMKLVSFCVGVIIIAILQYFISPLS